MLEKLIVFTRDRTRYRKFNKNDISHKATLEVSSRSVIESWWKIILADDMCGCLKKAAMGRNETMLVARPINLLW